jgi:ring-1,2-phenylacetyl-CoA epoxidase subunit PaaC
VDAVWPLTDELFHPHEIELRLTSVAVDPSTLRLEFDAVLAQVLSAATLTQPSAGGPAGSGRDGVHGPELDEVLAEMQGTARSLPGGLW